MKTSRGGVSGWLMILFLAAVAFAAVYAHRAPAPLPETAPATEFSAFRAFKHIEATATEPHRSGTEANFKIRDYIVETLRGMGVEPMVSDEITRRGDLFANPQNVMARVPGTANTKAFLLMAHYDSTPYGPGAADDLSGVAAMLETCRALKAGPPLKNDVMLVFTDGEECGLLGANAFLNHPWAKEVGLMLNFEARGVQGPSYLFETSSGNGWLIPHIAKAAPYPMMSSMMFDVYIRMPTTSDYKILKNTIPGMNAAFIDYIPYYHTALDNPEYLSKSSLQHHGSYALSFARYFGNLDLNTVQRAPDAVYFDAFGTWLVHYPGGWNIPITILTGLAFVAVAALALRKGRATAAGLVWGCAAQGLTGVAVAAIAAGIAAAAYRLRGIYFLYNSPMYLWAELGLTLCVAILLLALARRKLSVADLALGVGFWWAVLMVLCTVLFPGAAFVFQWPLLFSLLGLAVYCWAPETSGAGWGRWIVLALSAVPAILIVAPNVYAFYSGILIIGAPAYMLLTALLLGLLVPHLDLVDARGRSGFALLLGGAGLVCFVVAVATGGFNAQHPKMNCISYAMDSDLGETYWVSSDPEPDPWTAQFFAASTPHTSLAEFGITGEYFKAPAPFVRTIIHSLVKTLSDTIEKDGRIALRITSPRNAARVVIYGSAETEVSNLFVNGRSLGRMGKEWTLDYSIFPKDGVELILDTEPRKHIMLRIVDYSYELPEVPELHLRPRPPDMICEPNTVGLDRPLRSGVTMTMKTFFYGPQLDEQGNPITSF